VDELPGGIAAAARRLGRLARRPQTGQLHQYYAQLIIGLGVLAVILLLRR
jgi:NADH-quinone oxidoreductase subunit L